MKSGGHDGSNRHDYFQRVILSLNLISKMLGVRMSVRLNDRANLWLAEEGCQQVELLLNETSPATLDRVQDWLRAETLEVEDYLRRLNTRDKRRKERWRRSGKPDREAAARLELHLEQIERRKWIMEARRQILRQIGDAIAWAILRTNPRIIQPLYAKGRNHHLSQDQGSFGPQSIIKQAHTSGRFYVLDTDLTRCLGIGDVVTVPVHDLWLRPLVYEVKTKAAGDGHVAIWLIGAKPTTPVDLLVQEEFCSVIGLTNEPEQALREREQRQLEEVKSGTYRINDLWKRLSRILGEPNYDHWAVIAKVLDQAEHGSIAFDYAEPGVVYAATRNGPGDNHEALVVELITLVEKHGFGADAGYGVLMSLELSDPDQEALASMSLPIALWKLNRHHRSMLLNDVLCLYCFFEKKVWEKALAEERVRFQEEHGWWRMSHGTDSIVLDPHEVVKLKLGLAFGGMSPRAFAENVKKSLESDLND